MSGRALQCRTDGSFLGSRLIKRIKLDRALEQDKQAGVRKAKGMRNAFLPLPHSGTSQHSYQLSLELTRVAAGESDSHITAGSYHRSRYGNIPTHTRPGRG